MSGVRLSIRLDEATVAQLRVALARTEGRTGTNWRQSSRQLLYARRRDAILAELHVRGVSP